MLLYYYIDNNVYGFHEHFRWDTNELKNGNLEINFLETFTEKEIF